MGLDLTLCPYEWGFPSWSELPHLAYTRIRLQQQYGLFQQIDETDRVPSAPKLKPRQLPSGVDFRWYEDEGVVSKHEDPYGRPLTYVEAGELSRIDDSGASAWNRAALAFIRALPPDTPIVLWWH